MAPSKSTSSALTVALFCLCAIGLAGPAVAGPRRSSRLIKQGIALHNSASYEQAIRLYQDAYQDDPRLTKALLLIGASYLNLGRAEEVLEFYERYEQKERRLRPADQERLRGYYDEAAIKLQLDYDADPRRVELLLFAGRAHHDLGRLEEALIRYERFAREAPPGDRHRERLRGYYEQALGDLRHKFAESRRPELLLLLGRVCTDLGREEEAANYAEHYRQLRPPTASHAAPVAFGPPAPPRPALPTRLHEFAPSLQSPPPQVRPPRSRPVWRVATGAAFSAVGLGVAGLGISALAVDGSCIQPPGQTCQLDYATQGIGAGLLVGGLLVTIGGAALIAIPGPWPAKSPRLGLGIGPTGAGLSLAGVF